MPDKQDKSINGPSPKVIPLKVMQEIFQKHRVIIASGTKCDLDEFDQLCADLQAAAL